MKMIPFVAFGVACGVALAALLPVPRNPVALETRDTGLLGTRRVPGNLDCQYYATFEDADLIRTGNNRVLLIYLNRMLDHCNGEVTIVYPDRSTEILRR